MPCETPAEALELLRAGNERFVAGTPHREPIGARLTALAKRQSPFAVVLGCSDSRVPIESVFDQQPGSLFVVRVAGNFLNDDNLGSIEFGVQALGARLVVVLGHHNCGAVTAALDYVRDGTVADGHIQSIVEAVAPAVRATRDFPGDWLENATAENVRLNVAATIGRSKIVAEPVAAGTAAIAGALYDVRTGRVTFSE